MGKTFNQSIDQSINIGLLTVKLYNEDTRTCERFLIRRASECGMPCLQATSRRRLSLHVDTRTDRQSQSVYGYCRLTASVDTQLCQTDGRTPVRRCQNVKPFQAAVRRRDVACRHGTPRSLARRIKNRSHRIKLAFHDADTDTDFLADILARILARMSVSVSAMWNSSFNAQNQWLIIQKHCTFYGDLYRLSLFRQLTVGYTGGLSNSWTYYTDSSTTNSIRPNTVVSYKKAYSSYGISTGVRLYVARRRIQ